MTEQTTVSPGVMIEMAVEEGIEAASRYVSSLPLSQRAWGSKEYQIAETAAREAIAALRQAEADTQNGVAEVSE